MAEKQRQPTGHSDSGKTEEELRRRVRELEGELRKQRELNVELEVENAGLRGEIRRRREEGRCKGQRAPLLQAMDTLFSEWRGAFKGDASFQRIRHLAYGMLLSLGRKTVTGALTALGQRDEDWSANYRVFSEGRYEAADLFDPVIGRCVKWPGSESFFVIALDDSSVRKTGKKMPYVTTHRDPLSPPYRVNLRRGLRFVQASAVLPMGKLPGPQRGIPMGLEVLPSPRKPGKKASEKEHEDYEEAAREAVLGRQAARLAGSVVSRLKESKGWGERKALVCVDGSMANRTFLRALPEGVHFLARVRGDAALHRPAEGSGSGRRVYGDRLPTPEEIRQAEDTPYEGVSVYAAGRLHESMQVKSVAPVLWQRVTQRRPLRLIVIAPLKYRPPGGAWILYREPAYLLTSDLETPVAELIQAYVGRWEIEVNFKDEKTLLGLGQAQVWSEKSVRRLPAFVAACYGVLLMATLQAFGSERTEDFLPRPRWRRDPPRRASTQDMVGRLRVEAWGTGLHVSGKRSSVHEAGCCRAPSHQLAAYAQP